MAIISEFLDYKADGQTCKGYLAYPEGKTPAPCVLVVHEWWGQTDYPRKRADMLAEQGYAAFAVDMYGEGHVGTTPQEAGDLMNALMGHPHEMKRRFLSAYNFISGNPHVKHDQIAAIGYCMGGKIVLDMARAGLDLVGVCSYHGILQTATPAQVGNVKAKVRVFHGNDDVMATLEHVAAFETEMDNAGVDYKVVGYDNTTHGFTNPAADDKAAEYGMPLGYSEHADKDSWNRTLEFLKEIF